MKEQICKNCEHYSGSRYSRCDIKLPFWAEPYSRPTVYGQDGDGCPAFEECSEWGSSVDAALAAKDATIARMAEALEALDQWSKAYPISTFPEPDLARVAEVLKAAGLSLDSVSASNMRHVVKHVGEAARAALEVTR